MPWRDRNMRQLHLANPPRFQKYVAQAQEQRDRILKIEPPSTNVKAVPERFTDNKLCRRWRGQHRSGIVVLSCLLGIGNYELYEELVLIIPSAAVLDSVHLRKRTAQMNRRITL
ncbi:hypothetical protein EVAR_50336_1 [Eumeta japonica]|uniref:Uncharacterized protein n=1 Tax=Eumeta variegata TaxID=151549 RepID=A0A4C1XNV7_EUMVA|nr:hypothetical protein EVAR_50336_1 [Eumeta japonica]